MIANQVKICFSVLIYFDFVCRCQDAEDEPHPLIQKIVDILYATEVSFKF